MKVIVPSVTSLGGEHPPNFCSTVRAPARAQFPILADRGENRFLGAEARSTPLSMSKSHSLFGIVSDGTYRQAL